jgi:hypothetical protein
VDLEGVVRRRRGADCRAGNDYKPDHCEKHDPSEAEYRPRAASAEQRAASHASPRQRL